MASTITPSVQAVEQRRSAVEELRVKIRNWGRWGSTDEAGCFNLISPKKRTEAAALIKQGKSISLSRSILAENDVFERTSRHLARLPTDPAFVEGAPEFIIDIWSHSHHGGCLTHMDSLSHVFWKGVGYNGRKGVDCVTNLDGAVHGSIEELCSGFFTPVALLDFPRFKNVAYLPPGYEITAEDLRECAKAQGCEVHSGDALLIRTGFIQMKKALPEEGGTAGLHPLACEVLREWDVSLLGTDTHGEASPPFDKEFSFPTHVLCLVELGLNILDNADFEALSEVCHSQKCYRYALTLNPLRYQGGTGCPVNPIVLF